ncbi:MAG: alpha/beta fold hydrolase [Spirosomataceae bacterium]
MHTTHTLVLIHGFGMSSSIWNLLIKKFPKKPNLITVDYSKLTCQTIEEFADWLHDDLEAKGISSPILVGHSMGGYISLAYLEKYPKNVAGLVLFHSVGLADNDARKMSRQKTIEFIERNSSSLFLEEFLPTIFAPSFVTNEAQLVHKLVDEYKSLPSESIIAATEAMKARKGRMHLLASTHLPIGFIFGGQDTLISREKCIEQINTVQNPHVLWLSSVGHAAMVESPEVCASFLLNYQETCIQNSSLSES